MNTGRNKVGIIDKIGRTRLDRFEIRDGLDFLVEKAPKKFKPLLDVSVLTERYSNEEVREEKGESKIRTTQEWKAYFLNVYGLIVYGNSPQIL